MSARTGDRLEPALHKRLTGEWLASRATEAILIATLDDRGRPHPALLAYGEVVALTPTRIRLAVADTSTTARNLRARQAMTLCLIEADGVAYVKASARPLAPEPWLAARGQAAFEAHIEDVLVDSPAPGEAAWLTSGIRFAVDDPARYVHESAARIDALRRAVASEADGR
jgi:Pyridoxamine 5'-phosphate oxidase